MTQRYDNNFDFCNCTQTIELNHDVDVLVNDENVVEGSTNVGTRVGSVKDEECAKDTS